MQTVLMNLAIHKAQESFKKFDRLEKMASNTSGSWLARLVFGHASFLFLPKLRKHSAFLASTCKDFKLYILDIRQNQKNELIDSESHLNKCLEELKVKLREQQVEIPAVIHSVELAGDAAAKLYKELKIIQSLVNELYEEADQLQQVVAEHNMNFTAKLEAANALLKKINIDRMNEALSQTSIMMPKNLSREEMRRFIISHRPNA